MTPTLRPLIAGNWKMNGLLRDGTALARAVAAKVADVPGLGCEVALCPPATLLGAVAALLEGTPVALGGQDCHAKASGAHTGDIAAPMLADLGCRYVIVGHSERRGEHHETDATVRAKAGAARSAGLVPIICVGESEAEREAGHALDRVRGQIAGSLPPGLGAADAVIAYEPIWAIGTGKSARLDDIIEMHGAIRETLKRLVRDGDRTRILYGGSVKPDGALAICATAGVDGALVGGASLDAEAFWAIIQAAAAASA